MGEIIEVNPWKIAQYNHTKTKHKESMLMFYDTYACETQGNLLEKYTVLEYVINHAAPIFMTAGTIFWQAYYTQVPVESPKLVSLYQQNHNVAQSMPMFTNAVYN